MSLSTPILTFLSSASAEVAKPKAVKATSAAVRRADVIIIGISSVVDAGMALFAKPRPDSLCRDYPHSLAKRQGGQGLFILSGAFADSELRRRMKVRGLARLVVIELAGLGPFRRAHRYDELGDLIGRVQRHWIFARKHLRAHAGADRARAEQVDAQVGARGLVGPDP